MGKWVLKLTDDQLAHLLATMAGVIEELDGSGQKSAGYRLYRLMEMMERQRREQQRTKANGR